MENASKALIMAAGILIGLIIATLFSYEMISMSQTARTFQEEMNKKSIASFNNKFEQYLGRSLTAQQVVTIYNYIQKINNEFDGENYIELDTNIQILKDLLDGKKSVTMEDFLEETWDKEKKRFKLTIDESDYNKEGKITKVTIKE